MALPLANVAKYELTLPSQQKTINYRPFLVKEEKVLLMAMESGESKDMISAIKEIVKSCTFGEMLAENYPMFDIEDVFLQIRSKSVGEVAKIKVLCPDDGKTYADAEVDLSKIEVFVDDNHSNNIVIDEERKLGVTMKYPTLKDIDGDTLSGEVNIEKTYKMIENSIESIYEGEEIHFAKDIDKKELTEFLSSKDVYDAMEKKFGTTIDWNDIFIKRMYKRDDPFAVDESHTDVHCGVNSYMVLQVFFPDRSYYEFGTVLQEYFDQPIEESIELPLTINTANIFVNTPDTWHTTKPGNRLRKSYIQRFVFKEGHEPASFDHYNK